MPGNEQSGGTSGLQSYIDKAVDRQTAELKEIIKQQDREVTRRLDEVERLLGTLTSRESIAEEARFKFQHNLMWRVFLTACAGIGLSLGGALLYVAVKVASGLQNAPPVT